MAIVTTLCVGGIFTVNAAFDKKEPVKKEVTTYYYGNRGGGNYELLTNPVNLEDCQTEDPNICVLMSSELIEEGFGINSPEKPTDATPVPGSGSAKYTGL